MSLKKHYWNVYCETAAVGGSAFIAMAFYMQLNGIEQFSIDALWRIILLSAAIVLRGASLINYHELEDHTMRLNYLISSILSDLLLIAFLLYFTPGGKAFAGKSWIIFTVYIVLKSLFYLMLFAQSLVTARAINNRLHELYGE